jgi:hypothetical protein
MTRPKDSGYSGLATARSPGRQSRATRGHVRVYVAAPYAQGDVAANVRRAIDAADGLLRMGFVPYVPHLAHWWHLTHPHAEEVWVRLGLAWLRVCDAMLRLPGASVGVQLEVATARQWGIPVFDSIDELGGWAARRVSGTI